MDKHYFVKLIDGIYICKIFNYSESSLQITIKRGKFCFRPFDAKNPFLSPVSVNRELHREGSDRSCMHIEFDITGSKIRSVLFIICVHHIRKDKDIPNLIFDQEDECSNF